MKRHHIQTTRSRFKASGQSKSPFSERILMFDALVDACQNENPNDDYRPDSESLPSVSELREMMNRNTTMREAHIEEIRRKLSNDHYLTRAAAEESAQRIIDNGDLYGYSQQ